MPASHHEVDDLVFPAAFKRGVGRSLALTLCLLQEELQCFEFTGYRVPAGEGHRRFPDADTFTRNNVVDRSSHASHRKHE
jgi:hypothetical protein